jgi:two-component system, NarL family, response regulator DevR
MISVYVVDAREIFRRGMRDLLSEVDDIEIVGEAASADMATTGFTDLDPDIVLIDLDLSDGRGMELCEHVTETRPRTRVVMSCRHSGDDRIGAAMLAGASGYLAATDHGDDIIGRLRRSNHAGPSLDSEIVGDLFDRVRSGRPYAEEPLSTLTDRERQILDLLAEGLTNRDIGEELHLSPKTVKNYVSVILKKLGMSTRTEAAVYAARRAVRNDARS